MQIGWQRCSLGAAAALLCATLACWAAAPGAWAVPEHSFDAALSLEGGCKGEDGVPDPGCPGGTHPPEAFDDACGAAVDRNGDIYVASAATNSASSGTGGRIDVFNPKGEFLTEIKDEHQPCDLAVDSQGNLYVAEYQGKNVTLFEPGSYPPQAGEEYTATTIFENPGPPSCKSAWGVAVDPTNDHLYAALNCMVVEYASAAEGSGVIREGIASFLPILAGIDVYGPNHDLYLTSAVPGSQLGQPVNARLYVLDGASEEIKCETAGFSFFFGNSGVAVDQENGDAYVDDTTGNHAVKQFSADCAPIGQLPSPPVLEQPSPFAGIAVDSPCLVGPEEECNPAAPYASPNKGYVFVGSGRQANKSHLYAFAPKEGGPPEIKAQAVSGVSEGEARLEAKVNPHGFETSYHFEYVTQEEYEDSGYENATSTPAESAGAAASFGAVSAPVSGLRAGTAYRFRAVASNCAAQGTETECLTVGEGNPGGEGSDASFSTYPTPPRQPCPNEALRTGPSAELPDCRAYELVTPAQTNGRIPTMSEEGRTHDNGFPTDLTSADGGSLSFGVDGGSLPGSEGNGFHDTYVATRGAGGWQSEFSGLRGSETRIAYPGGIAPDNRYSFWFADGGDTGLARGSYLRGPGGSVEPIGMGSLGTDLEAIGDLVTAGGSHVIFTSEVRLEEAAPLPGTKIYDREADGPTKVVSLLPGNLTPAPSAKVAFEGASADGEAVAFTIDGTLYLRRGGETQEVAGGETETAFGGLSAGGGRLTYLRPNGAPIGTDPPHGDIFSYDAGGGETTEVGGGGESTLVNVSADGSHVFFVSPKQGVPGAYDLYVWDASTEAISFIATVTERDVFGEDVPDATATMTDGLGLWVNRVLHSPMGNIDGPGADPSRSTADGGVFVFESRAQLTAYPNEGRAEIYRYEGGELSCLSCNPTGSPAQGDARLQGPQPVFLHSLPPVNSLAHIANLTADGQTVFFQSAEPLVAADNDGRVDVYEWEAEGRGGCEGEEGCLSLISSGHSAANDYLYAMSPDGHDVFIETDEPLVPGDPDGGHSIYDARVDGGFAPAPPPPAPCQGADACRTPSPPPSLPNASSGPFAGQNATRTAGRRCPKGKRKGQRRGKARCVKGRSAKKHRRHGGVAR
jgi:hypothetical protein